MTENNTILKSGKLALFYALTTGLLAWVAGCVLVFAWPSGIFRKGVVNILGNGVALDPENLW